MKKSLLRLSLLGLLFTTLVLASASETKDRFTNNLSIDADLETQIEGGRVLSFGPLNAEPVMPPSSDDSSFDFVGYGLQSAFTDDQIIAVGYVPNEIVIEFDDSVDLTTDAGLLAVESTLVAAGNGIALTALQQFNAVNAENSINLQSGDFTLMADDFLQIDEVIASEGWVAATIGVDGNEQAAIDALKLQPGVQDAFFNAVFVPQASGQATPTDHFYGNQWALQPIAGTVTNCTDPFCETLNGVNKVLTRTTSPFSANNPLNANQSPHDINIEAARPELTNLEEVLVAVIDSGVAYNHPDLKNMMWDGSSCKVLDDEGKPVDGICPNHGWDFFAKDNDPYDVNGHGTHVAGIIAAEVSGSNDKSGIAGLAPNVKIMAVKAGERYASVLGITKAFLFARANNADVINASLTSFSGGPDFQVAVGGTNQDFPLQPPLLVAGAGNSGDQRRVAPAGLDFDNIISVAANDRAGHLTDFSNFGTNAQGDYLVDVAAPGANIISAYVDLSLADDFFGANFEGTNASPLHGFTPLSAGGTTNNWGIVSTKRRSQSTPNGRLLADSTVLANGTYAGNADTSLVLENVVDTSAMNTDFQVLVLEMDTWCDTGNGDYLQVQVSADEGVSWNTISGFYLNNDRISESSLGALQSSRRETRIINSTSYSGEQNRLRFNVTKHIGNNDNIHLRINWRTDASNASNHAGCYVDNITLAPTTNTKVGDPDNPGSPWNGKYAYQSGTSMATPHVTGLAALLYGLRPDLTVAQVKEAILQSSDVASLGSNNYVNASGNTVPKIAHGIIDVAAAIQYVEDNFPTTPPPVPPTTFNDVEPGDWFVDFVNYAAAENIVQGTKEADGSGQYTGDFEPGRTVNRAEVLKIAYTAVNGAELPEGSPASPCPQTSPFSDVATDAWYCYYVQNALDNGYINVAEEGSTFRPGENATRGETAFLVSRTLGVAKQPDGTYTVNGAPLALTDLSSTFPDIAGHQYEDHIAWMKQVRVPASGAYNLKNSCTAHVVDGYEQGLLKGQFGPDALLLRGEAAKIIAGIDLLHTNSFSSSNCDIGAGGFSLANINGINYPPSLGLPYEQLTDPANLTAPGPLDLTSGNTQVLNADNSVDASQVPQNNALTMAANQTLSLTGNTHDADGDEMFYFWQAEAGSLSSTDVVNFHQATWTPPTTACSTPDANGNCVYLISMLRGDNRGLIGDSTYTITVTPAPDDPNPPTEPPSLNLSPTITSLTSGGNWGAATTWHTCSDYTNLTGCNPAGRIPTNSDVVQIVGSVGVEGSPTVESVLVSVNGVLQNDRDNSASLTINGDVDNNGRVTDDQSLAGFRLRLYVNGNIVNNGTWDNGELTFFGTSDLSVTGSNLLESPSVMLQENRRLADDLTMPNIFSLNGKTLTVPSGKTLTVETLFGGNSGLVVEGVVDVNGRSTGPLSLSGSGTYNVHGLHSGNLTSTVGNLNLTGQNLQAGDAHDGRWTVSQLNVNGVVPFVNGSVINGPVLVSVNGVLQNDRDSSASLTINGDVDNNGRVTDDQSLAGFRLRLYVNGNIVNNGAWDNGETNLINPGELQTSLDGNSWLTNNIVTGGVAFNATNTLLNDETLYYRTRLDNTQPWGPVYSINGVVAPPAAIASIQAGLWSDGATWQGGVAPIATQDVIIDHLVTLDQSVTAKSLQVNVGGTLQSDGVAAHRITLAENLTNHGTINGAPLQQSGLQSSFNEVMQWLLPEASAASGNQIVLVVGQTFTNTGTMDQVTLELAGEVQNSGSITNSNAQLNWPNIAGALNYELTFYQQGEWQEPLNLSTNFYPLPDNTVTDGLIWSVRAQMPDQSFTAWSAPQALNMVLPTNLPLPPLTFFTEPSLGLILLDLQGQPIVGARVTLRETGTGDWFGATDTDESGAARFDVTSGDDRYLEIRHHGVTINTPSQVVTNAVTLNYQTVALTARFLASDSTPIAGSNLTLYTATGQWSGSGTTDDAGEIVFEVLPGSEHYVEVRRHGETFATPLQTISAATTIDIQMVPLTARFVTSDNTPIVGSALTLRTSTGQWSGGGATDELGEVVFEVLPGSEHYVEVRRHGEIFATPLQTITSATTIDIQMVPLTARFVTSDNTPIVGSTLTLRTSTGQWSGGGATDELGEVVFEVLPGSDYSVEVRRHGEIFATPLQTIGSATTVDIQMVPLTTRFVTSTGTPVAGDSVTLRTSTGQWSGAGTTDDLGQIVFEVLPNSDYLVEVRHYGEIFATPLQTVTGATTVDIQTIPLTVLVQDHLNQPISGESVILRSTTGQWGGNSPTDVNGEAVFEVLPQVGHQLEVDGNGSDILTINQPTTSTYTRDELDPQSGTWQ